LERDTLELTTQLFYRAFLTRVINPGLPELPESDLTLVQVNCLRYVYLHPEPSVGRIADGLKISDAAAAKLIDRLVKRELLTREEDPADRRVLKIMLTPTGAACLKKMIEAERECFKAIISRMSANSVTKLREGMAAFLAAALVSPAEIEEICLKCGWEHLPECLGNLRYQELTGASKKDT